MSADMVSAAHPLGPAGKRRKLLSWRQLLLVVLLLLVLAQVGLVVGYKIQHRPTTQAVAFSPEGHLLAAGSTDDRIRIWDVQNGTLLHTLSSETMKDVFALAFSPDGRVLASGSEGIAASGSSSSSGTHYQAVTFWDVKSGRRLSASNGGLLVGYSLAFSPDGRMLAVAALDGIALLRSSDGGILRCFPYNYARSVAFSPDGRVLAAGSEGGYDTTHHLHPSSIVLWDVASGKRLLTIPGQSGDISSLAFSPDGHLLATASAERAVSVWSVATGTLFRAFEGHTGAVTAVAFSPDGRMLAAGSNEQTIKLWDVQKGTLVRTLLGHSTAIASLAFSADGRTLASGTSDVTLAWWADQTVNLWDVNTGCLLRTLSG